MPHFPQAVDALTCRYQHKSTHGGNHAPSVSDWFKNDDTLDRQGVSSGKPNGHGICKGTASSWVIAFLNKVPDASDPAKFEDFYTNFLRYQATMVKDFGKHIDSHVEQFKKLGVDTKVKQEKKVEIVTVKSSDLPSHGVFGHRWGAYISVWHHDIAIGGTSGFSSKYYIVEPNTGLLGYNSKSDFLEDLNEYIDQRRTGKGHPSTTPAGFWFYKAS
jgi:hypothetical protein